jgi:carnitine-CoA ligase
MAVQTTDWVVGKVLASKAASKPDLVLIETTDGTKATVGEFDLRANQIGNYLQQLGVSFGDRVIAILNNGIEIIQCWFGICRTGVIFVPINPSYRGDFLKHVVVDSGAKIAIVSPDALKSLAAIEKDIPNLETVIVVVDEPTVDGSRFKVIEFSDLARGSSAKIDVAVSVRDPCMTIYTSGTTGSSKGVVLPHGSAYMNAHIFIRQLELSEMDRVYCCLPLYHTNALDTQIYASLILGCPILLAKTLQRARLVVRYPRFWRNRHEHVGCHDRLHLSSAAVARRRKQFAESRLCGAYSALARKVLRRALRGQAG